MKGPWYATWFDTEFYHDLYRHRDESEARGFIEELCQSLGTQKDQKALDMACGKGRHAKVMSELGLITTGIDLSAESIAFASKWSGDRLQFMRGNMLEPLPAEGFDWVFNLFTSFGYFESDADHALAIQHMADALKPGGKFVMDYMNSRKIAAQLVPANTVETEMASYSITRSIESGTIVKRIEVQHADGTHGFEERVRAFEASELERFVELAGLKVVDVKGDYALNDYVPDQSERLILIAQKPI